MSSFKNLRIVDNFYQPSSFSSSVPIKVSGIGKNDDVW